ncbi:MAG: AAA family ATPase [Polyangiaceae bacterium]|nr:AAA family ATPase [Polyangiaceae bacterium]
MMSVAGPGVVEAFERAWASGRRVMRLAGPPGSGRSTTAAALARLAAARGCVTAHGSPAPAGVPFGAWLAVARALGSRAEAAWARVLEGPSGEPRAARERRAAEFGGLAGELVAACGGRELLAVLDDADEADHGTRALAAWVASGAGPPGLRVLLTSGEGEAASWVPPPDGGGLSVPRLDVESLGRLVGGALGPATLEEVLERTGGHAGLALAAAHAALEQPVEAPLAIPDAYADHLAARLSELDPPSRRVLAALAVAGGAASCDALAAVLEFTQGGVEASLEAAVAVALVEVVSGAARIPSATARRVALDAVPEAERRALHLTWAAALQRRGGAEPARLAWHRVRALPLGRVDAALEAARHGVTRLLRARAFEDARALGEAAAVVGARWRGDPRALAELDLVVTRAALACGEVGIAGAAAARAAAAFERLGDHDARCRALLAECEAAPAVDPERLAARLDEALASLGDEPTPLRARVAAARASLAAPTAERPPRPQREPAR